MDTERATDTMRLGHWTRYVTEDGLPERFYVGGCGEQVVHPLRDPVPRDLHLLGRVGLLEGGQRGVTHGCTGGLAGVPGGLELVEEAHLLVHTGDDAVLLG